MDYGIGTTTLLYLSENELNVNDLRSLNVTAEHFVLEGDKKVHKFCLTHFIRYRKMPERAVIVAKFPQIADYEAPPEPLQFFADKMIDLYQRQKVLDLSAELATGVRGDTDVLETLVEASKAITHIQKSGLEATTTSGKVVTLSEGMQQALDAAVKRRHLTGEVLGAPFGFDFLDQVTDGAQPGDFITIAGRPASCKTHIICNSANAALDSSFKPMFATFEMPIVQLSRRLAERRTNLSSKQLKFGRISTRGQGVIEQEIADLKTREDAGKVFNIFQGDLYTQAELLEARINEIEPTVLYVDGAYLLRVGKGSAQHEHVTEGAHFLKNIALKYNIPVIATYQLNRRGVGKNAGIDTMMYSDAMAQLASVALIIKTPEEANTGQPTQWGSSIRRILVIDKGRDGEKGEVEVELNFGMRPFRVTKVLNIGDIEHLGIKADAADDHQFAPSSFAEAE